MIYFYYGAAGFAIPAWQGIKSMVLFTTPSPPLNLTAQAGDAQVTLSWDAPTNNGGQSITNYKIYRGTTPGNETLLVTVDNILTYTNTGLTNGQTHYYKVSAINSVEESILSEEFAITPEIPIMDGGWGDGMMLYVGIGVIAILAAIGIAIIKTRRNK